MAALHDLHKQATTENSHFYTASVISAAMVEITKLRIALNEITSTRADLLAANEELLGLVRRAQERLCAYLCPEGSNDADECMNDLLGMFDGPEQRRIEGAARAAISKATQEPPHV